MTGPEAFIAAARSFVGTPFHAGARCPGVGLDCIGVVVCAARACALEHRDIAAYSLRPNGQLIPELERQLQRARAFAPGDVLAIAFDNAGEPHHVAVLAQTTLIHAYLQARKCVEQPFGEYWCERVRGIFRFREFAAAGA